jgi:L-Ala-D/L-Glu epimerase
MAIRIKARVERWPVAGQFVIARGAKDHVDVVVAEVSDGEHTGRGEGTPIYYKGETAEGCAETLNIGLRELDLASLQTSLPNGAARNALDCALWDLESNRTNRLIGNAFVNGKTSETIVLEMRAA